jgi:hypothetical protein
MDEVVDDLIGVPKIPSLEIEPKIYPPNNIYKVHIFDSNGIVKKIHIFCAKTKTVADLNELFSDLELSNHGLNAVEYIFSEQLIHPDDSIKTIKKKIIADIGSDLISYEELYLFGFMKTRIDMKEIYQRVTQNETVEVTKEGFQQLALNINADISNVKKIDFEKEQFTFDDFLDLKDSDDSDDMKYVNKPIGMEFHNFYDFLFSANPFYIHSKSANGYEMNSKNQLLAFENQLLLNYGKLESNNIYLCLVKNVFEYSTRVGIADEYISEIYYPILYNKEIQNLNELITAQPELIKETSKSITKSTLSFYKNIDLFHKIFYNHGEELNYVERGISRYQLIMRSSDFDHPFPLDVLFKNMHATNEMPFIKFNPGSRRENMYRFYSNKIAKNGKKIPFLPESMIMKLSKDIGKSHQIAILLKQTYKKISYNVVVSFDANSKMQLKGDLSPPLLIEEFEEFIGQAVNPIITLVRGYLYSSGYSLHSFRSLQDDTIEKFNFKYKAILSIDKKVDLKKYKSCMLGIFDFLSEDVASETGAQMRFKRVENFKEMDAQYSFISEIYQRAGDSREVIEALMETYQMSEQDAEFRLAQYSSEHQQLKGRFLENPGFPVIFKMIDLKNDVSIEVDEIIHPDYIDILHIYIDSILRITQQHKGISKNLVEKIKTICSKKKVEQETKDSFGTENIITTGGITDTTELFKIRPLQFGKDEEVLDEDEDTGGIYFDDDYDYEETEVENSMAADAEVEDDDDEYYGGAGEDGEEKKDTEETDDKYVANIDGMALKNPNPFLKLMTNREPTLFLSEKQGKYALYSSACPFSDRRQPVILTDAEKKRIDATNPGSYTNALKYGTDPKNPYWYICPRYWCLKTNSSISEEDVKAGKCGDIIPQNAKVVPKGAYVYEFANPKEHFDKDGKYKTHIPSFLDKKKHPNGLCIPCCFAKSWNSKQHQELRAKCSQEGATTNVTKQNSGVEKQSFYVMSPSTSPLPENRWGFLPLSLQYFLGTDNSLAVTKLNAALIKPGVPCLLRIGVEHNDKQSFLACVAYYYAYKQNLKTIPSISEMRNILADSLDLDMFLKYHNGSLLSIFRPNRIEQEKVDIDKHMNTNFAKTIDLNNESQLDFLEDTIASFDNFIAFLKNETSEIDHTYLWDIVTDRNPKLMRDGFNLVILEIMNSDVTNNIQMICPSSTYSQVKYNPVRETIVLIKQESYYEPLQLYQLENESDVIVKKAFLEHNAIKNIKTMLELIKRSTQKFCHPLASKPRVYTFKQNIVASELARLLRSFQYNIGSQILNYNKKVIGLCVNKEEGQNFIYVPCYPSSVLDGIQIRYMDDDGIWLDYKTTRDRLSSIHRESGGKIMCLPKLKIMEDKLIVGIMTETNQFVQIDPPAEDVFTDGLNKIEHYDYPIKNRESVDKTLATVSYPDRDRVKAIHDIKVESQFYNIFRSVIRIELNEFENRNLRKTIQAILENNDMLYHAKLSKVDNLLRELTKDSVSFQEFEQKTVDAFIEITMCNQDQDGKCISDPSKQYCLTTETEKGCRTIFPKNHLVSGVDNEKVYFGRIADELIRYRRIRLFMFQTKTYLNITNTDYHIYSNELFLLESLLTREYFKDLVPYNRNEYIKNIHYDDAQPEESQPYANDLSLTEQFALIKDDEKADANMSEYVLDCIKETKARVIGNDKLGSWRPFFPSTAKEILFMNSVTCSFIPVIYILQQILKSPISMQNVKTTLWNGYSKLMEIYRDKILEILRSQGKRELVDLVFAKKSTFEHVIFSDGYYLTDLDLWVIFSSTKTPVILFSSTKLKYLIQTIDWLRLGNGKSEPGTKYHFIRSPATISLNTPPAYQMISPSFSLDEMKNDMFLKAERGDSNYIENIQSIETFLAKYHLIRKKIAV